MDKKKILLLIYCKTEGCRQISNTIKNELEKEQFEVDLEEIKPKLELKEFEYSKLNKIELASKPVDVKKYDLIVLGLNVWTLNINPVIETYLKGIKNAKNKKFALYLKCVVQGNSARKVESIINMMQSTVIKKTNFQSIFDITPKMVFDAKRFSIDIVKTMNAKKQD